MLAAIASHGLAALVDRLDSKVRGFERG